jgi:hypothetical protein
VSPNTAGIASKPGDATAAVIPASSAAATSLAFSTSTEDRRQRPLFGESPSSPAASPSRPPTRPSQSCVRLHSLADGANGAPPCRAPDNSGAGGPHEARGFPTPGRGAARVCFTSSALNTPSRTAVTGVTSRAGATATLSAAHGLTARAAHNVPPSAGSGKARLADIPAKQSQFAVAVSARTTRAATGTATGPGSPA